jgi:sugar/nucleoside kinase (ribokinase family)
VSGVLNATPVHAYAVPVDMVDATGAGDAFCAGVIAALLRGRAPAAATQCGARAAARIVSQAGGMVTDAAVMAGVFDEDEGGLWKS